jgi:hypothetical protein
LTDTNFPKILEELARIHEEFPDIPFGRVLQSSVDQHKQGKNIDFHMLPSKILLSCLESFKLRVRKNKNKPKKMNKVINNDS